MTTPTDTQAIVIERHLPHPARKVWRALTEGALLDQWLMPGDFVPIVGHRFTLHAPSVPNWNGVTEGEVLLVEPHTRLSYRWTTTGAAGPLHTTVTWTITPDSAGVVLRLEQSGFRPQDRPNLEGATRGWSRFLQQLDLLLTRLA
ncbi:SRPBCC family protein [Deinococcus pimensis]|uniref:SRPBCC family protein n=1 Tax=Deinococcus pimensis TaxID=309888 RepID=UPI000489B706|nr:SRPBCC domain-containing protein [Deinococcus pimensis]